jgi:folate-binding protein YgfZ
MQNAYNLLNVDALVSISGLDAKKYLQGQLTCDMNTLSLQKATLGAYCNLKGRCVALFRILQIADNHYILRLNQSTLPKFLAQLKKYAMFSKIVIEDVSAQWHGFVVYDENPGDAYNTVSVDGAFITTLEGPKNWSQWIAPRDVAVPAEFKVIDDSSEWLYEEIVCGIPCLMAETQEAFLPHHLNLIDLGAVSFTKGCYLGQEIVARMQHLGKIKKRLQFVHLDHLVRPLEILKNAEGQEMELVNVAADPAGGFAALVIAAI